MLGIVAIQSIITLVSFLSSPELLGTPRCQLGNPSVETPRGMTGRTRRGRHIGQFTLFIHLNPIDIGLVPILLLPVDGKYDSPTHSFR